MSQAECDECGATVVADFVRCDNGKHYDDRGEYVGKIVDATAEWRIEVT